MNSFPSNKIMITTILLVALGFGIKFMTTSNTQFFQLNFDWDKEEPLKTIGSVRLDSVSYNYVKVSHNEFEPSPQHTYKLSLGNKSYYFRYVFLLRDGDAIEFKGVEWITDTPETTKVDYSLKEVFLPLKTGNGPTVVTLGDRFLINNEAKYYRKDLTTMFPVTFKGGYYDVFDFAHEARNLNTSEDILKKINSLPQAEFYILMYGSNEEMDSLQTFKRNTLEIIELLKAKSPTKIIFITLPPSKDKIISERNAKLNSIFIELSKSEKVEWIDSFELFSDNLDKFIRKDGVNITRDGYYELAKETTKRIK